MMQGRTADFIGGEATDRPAKRKHERGEWQCVEDPEGIFQGRYLGTIDLDASLRFGTLPEGSCWALKGEAYRVEADPSRRPEQRLSRIG
jgi:hypothetical protein